jgi:hypothetical protein
MMITSFRESHLAPSIEDICSYWVYGYS